MKRKIQERIIIKKMIMKYTRRKIKMMIMKYKRRKIKMIIIKMMKMMTIRINKNLLMMKMMLI